MVGIRRLILIATAVLGTLASTPLPAQKPPASNVDISASADDILPPDFRGRISYRGTHEGQLSRAGPPLRSLRVRDVMRSATGGSTREFAGAYNLEMTFEGRAVSGRYSGTGGISSGSFTGTRDGDRCRLIDDRSGTVTEAFCTRTRFYAEVRAQVGRDTSTARLQANATQIVDAILEEQQQRAAEQARIRRAEAQPVPPSLPLRPTVTAPIQSRGQRAANEPLPLTREDERISRCLAGMMVASMDRWSAERLRTLTPPRTRAQLLERYRHYESESVRTGLSRIQRLNTMGIAHDEAMRRATARYVSEIETAVASGENQLWVWTRRTTLGC